MYTIILCSVVFNLHYLFILDFFINIFKRGTSYSNDHFPTKIDKKSHACFTYKNQIVLISKTSYPTWYVMHPETTGWSYLDWESCSINLRDTVIHAGVYRDYVYIFGM